MGATSWVSQPSRLSLNLFFGGGRMDGHRGGDPRCPAGDS